MTRMTHREDDAVADLPFACCPDCECPASQAIGHDDTCTICQRPDGSPMTPDHESSAGRGGRGLGGAA